MAISAIAGLAATLGAAGAAGALASFGAFAAFVTSTAALTAFAIGAGLSIVSRALMPKPDFGAMMEGVTGTVREPTASRKIIYGKVRVGGAVVFIANSNANKDLYLVICFACHEIEGYEAVYLNDEKVWENGSYVSDWASYANFAFYDGTQTQGDSTLSNASVFWGADTHILNGIAYMRVKLTWDEDRKKFPQGVPNVSAVIKGKKLYDPRVSATSANNLVAGTSYYINSIGGSDFTLVGASENKVGVEFVATGSTSGLGQATAMSWSQNPALALRDYMVNSYYGLGEAHENIDRTSFIDAANVCDEAVTLDAGGTHDRYHANGVLDTANAIKGNIEALTAAMGGRIGYVDGKYFAQAAKYYTPTITIDESMMVGPMSVQTKQSRRSMYNGVKGVFLSEEENYTLVDYPAKISSEYSADDGDPIFLDMPLPFVTNNIRAQRLAKIALLKSRQQTVVNVPLNLAALKFKAGDFIAITNDRMDWSAKPFEVIGYDLQISNDGAIIVNVQAIETDSDVYDWTASTDEDPFNEPSDPTVNDGTTVGAPQAPLNLSEYTLANSDGSTITGLKISWTASDDGFIEYYEVEVTDSADTLSTFFNTTTETEIQIAGLRSFSTSGVTYNVKVRAVNTIGVRSEDLTGSIAMTGDTTAPALPTGLAVASGAKSITLTWTNPTDIDFKHCQVFVSTTDSIPANPTALVDAETFTIDGLTNGDTRYFWLKSVDFSDNVSSETPSISGTVGGISNADIDVATILTDRFNDAIITSQFYNIKTFQSSDASRTYPLGTDTINGTDLMFKPGSTLRLPGPADTSRGVKAHYMLYTEWQIIDGSDWTESDLTDPIEIKIIIKTGSTYSTATIINESLYVHFPLQDDSALPTTHAATLSGQLTTASTENQYFYAEIYRAGFENDLTEDKLIILEAQWGLVGIR